MKNQTKIIFRLHNIIFKTFHELQQAIKIDTILDLVQFNLLQSQLKIKNENYSSSIHKGSNIQYNQLFRDIDSFTKYEGILLRQIKQKHTIKLVRPRQRVLTIQNCQSPHKTLPVRSFTQQKQRTPTYKHYKSNLKYNTLPYLLQC